MDICSQKENIGELKKAANNLEDAVKRLDKRINGTFDTIGQHIAEAPEYRSRIDVIDNTIKLMKEEKFNTTKNSQWRIGLIVGVICTLSNVAVGVLIKIF